MGIVAERQVIEKLDVATSRNQSDTFKRAVDNQVFVGMCSPARDMSAGYHAVRLSLSLPLVIVLNPNLVGALDGRRPDVCIPITRV